MNLPHHTLVAYAARHPVEAQVDGSRCVLLAPIYRDPTTAVELNGVCLVNDAERTLHPLKLFNLPPSPAPVS